MKRNAKTTSKNTESTSTTPQKSGTGRYSGKAKGTDRKKGVSSLSAKPAAASLRSSTLTARVTSGSSPSGRRVVKRERLTSVKRGEHLGPDQSDWARVDAMTEEDIQRAIAGDPDTFTVDDWTSADLIMPVKKRSIHMRVDPDVLEYFRSTGRGYLTRMNSVLRAYTEAQKRTSRGRAVE